MNLMTADIAMPPSQRLREATREVHAAVEALPRMQALADGALDHHAYLHVLRDHAALIGGWEHAQHAWLAGHADADWHYRWRLPRLVDDLAALGEPLPASLPPPDAGSDAARWGMLYVIEGSQLGGRLIARRLRAHQPTLQAALGYFELGEGQPGAWRAFQQRLARELDDAAALQAAEAGARAMFAHFHRRLQAE